MATNQERTRKKTKSRFWVEITKLSVLVERLVGFSLLLILRYAIPRAQVCFFVLVETGLSRVLGSGKLQP
jgi:hypothetical protein